MERLKELREGKHISQQRLAEYFHISADYLLETSDNEQNIYDSCLPDTEKQLVFIF